MRYVLPTMIVSILIGSMPASAAPQWVEDYCFKQAQLVRPALRWDEQEAFMANCIADYTASPQAKPRKYKKRRY